MTLLTLDSGNLVTSMIYHQVKKLLIKSVFTLSHFSRAPSLSKPFSAVWSKLNSGGLMCLIVYELKDSAGRQEYWSFLKKLYVSFKAFNASRFLKILYTNSNLAIKVSLRINNFRLIFLVSFSRCSQQNNSRKSSAATKYFIACFTFKNFVLFTSLIHPACMFEKQP